MISPASRWKLGLFVVVGSLVGVFGVVYLGARELQRSTQTAYAYFDEALTGLEEGSAVKFRGITVGRVERIRNSVPLWLQLLMVILAAWLLSGPRWMAKESVARVVLVLDSSASMSVFKDRLRAGISEHVRSMERLAARTEYIVLDSAAAEERVFHGEERGALLDRLKEWQPSLGAHDIGPSLRLARGLAGESGVVGNFPFDPTGQDSPAMKVKEIKNGRLAMMSFLGMVSQYAVTGTSPLEGLKAHMANPTQVNIFTSSVGNEFVAAIIFCSIAPCYFVLQEQISDGSDDEFRPIPW